MYRIFCIALLLVGSSLAAQDPAEIFHRTLEVDSIELISLELYPGDSLRVEPWAGNQLLIETSVMLHNGKHNVMEFFKQQGRWDLKDELAGADLRLTSVDMIRRIVKSDRGSIREVVEIVIYLPEDFEPAGGNTWRRKED